MEAKIVFKDGTTINAQVNGHCYIVDVEPTFPEDLTDIIVKKGKETQTIANGRIVPAASVDGRYWFAIIEISEAEEEANQLRADVDYLLAISE